jgi:hypothetical protein
MGARNLMRLRGCSGREQEGLRVGSALGIPSGRKLAREGDFGWLERMAFFAVIFGGVAGGEVLRGRFRKGLAFPRLQNGQFNLQIRCDMAKVSMSVAVLSVVNPMVKNVY